MVAVLGYSREHIVEAVKEMYTLVADVPTSTFHFPVGRKACDALGYPREQTDPLPETLLESFAGVGNPFNANLIQPGDTVLDIGAGAGTDSLIAAGLVGSKGQVIALDITPAMIAKLSQTLEAAGYTNVTANVGSAEAIPLPDKSVDVITSNGALNLVPDKRRAITEMFRVLRPGGRLQIADVVIRRPVTVDCDDDPRLWVECVVGATVDEDLVTLFRDCGFQNIKTVRVQDYFAHSPSAQTREIATSFGAYSMELSMRRGERAPSPLQQWLKRLNPQRWVRAIWRRGLTGVTALLMALISCYGTLGALALLPLLGMNLILDEGIWALTIAAFTVITAVAVAAGWRRHGSTTPVIGAVIGVGIINYALFINYHLIVEATGFLVLAGAAGWDLYLKRRSEARALGLSS